MKFSLVLCTINRVDDVERFLFSLRNQSYKNYELILVDQNSDDRLLGMVAGFGKDIEIKHVKSLPGLSRARNVGLGYVRGEIVGFPDDDCWYPENLLEDVARIFASDPEVGFLSGKTHDGKGNYEKKWSSKSVVLNRYNIWRNAISFTIFIRNSSLNNKLFFDENIGVGAGTNWGSGEESDFLIRLMNEGCKGKYNPLVTVYHPIKISSLNNDDIDRAVRYARGVGYVWGKNRYPVGFVFLAISLCYFRSFFSLIKNKKLSFVFHREIGRARLMGWRDYKN